MSTPLAAVEQELRYSANLEAHSEDEEESFSTLALGLRDDRDWTYYSNEYDLLFALNYDHRNNEDNAQSKGFYSGVYELVGEDFVWDIDATFEVLPEESGTEVDTFESQVLTTASTGPTLRLLKSLRGITTITALASSIDYSESDLDYRQGDLLLRHQYPFSRQRNLTATLFGRSLRFEDEVNSENDYDAKGINVEFFSDNRLSLVRIEASITEFDTEFDVETEPEGAFSYLYRLSARSSLTLNLENRLRTSAEFNRSNPTDSNDLFIASPIRNKRVALIYAYLDPDNFADASIYAETVEPIFVTEEADAEDIRGISASWVRRIGPDWSFLIEADVSENDVLEGRFESYTSSLSYTRRHNQRVSSVLSIAVEIDEFDNDRVQDNILAYRLNAGLL